MRSGGDAGEGDAMTATPARDSDSEMEEMPLRERMATFDEELAEYRGLVERLAPGPPKVIAPLTVAEAFDLLDAAKAKDQVRHPPTPDPDPRPTSGARGSRDEDSEQHHTLRGEAARDARDARNPATALIPSRTDVHFSIPLPVILLQPVLIRPLPPPPPPTARSHPIPPDPTRNKRRRTRPRTRRRRRRCPRGGGFARITSGSCA